MKAAALALVVLSVALHVGGQVFFKLAMDETGHTRRGRFPLLATGVVVMSLGFFLWLAMLSHFPLSTLYPFEGLERVFLVGAAAIFLKERITFRLAFGVTLICAGIALVTAG
jgi:drug/metabolite transporter (DMT)-like permease